MIDKAKVNLRGTFEFAHRAQLGAWCSSLMGSALEEGLFGPPRDNHRRQTSNRDGYRTFSVLPGLWTLSGNIELRYTDISGGLRLDLNLNPTRTLAHLLNRYDADQLPNLTGYDFFRRTPGIREEARSLDLNDNFLSGRGVPRILEERAVFFTEYLRLYEVALQQLLVGALVGTMSGDGPAIDGPDIVMTGETLFSIGDADSPSIRGPWNIRLHWGRASLTQCECYWERRVQRSVPWMRRFADRAIAAARDVRVRHYELQGNVELSREAGSLAVTTDLGSQRREPGAKAKKELVVYAKDIDRVRFEVRYFSDLPRRIASQSPRDVSRLSSLMLEARTDAVDRLPWSGMHRMMQSAPEAVPLDVVDLAEHLRSALESLPGGFSPALQALLTTGGITSTGVHGLAPTRVLEDLRRRGVLAELHLVQLPRSGVARRYCLTPQYIHLQTLYGTTFTDRGFSPYSSDTI